MLTAIIFLPLVGAFLMALFLKKEREIKWASFFITLITLALALGLFIVFDRGGKAPQFEERYNWIPALKIQYHLGVDGLSVPFVLLTAFLAFCGVIASWSIAQRHKEYFFWFLLMETAVLGVFSSLDLILFFLFWEVELVPMYFLISIWGSGRKAYSAMKYVAFTFLGSAFMLAGILSLFFTTGATTFDMLALGQVAIQPTFISLGGLFLLFFTAFAIKLPIWPLHTWLPDAHTDAPTAVSVMLAGVLLKMGGYGIIRINMAYFPEVFQTWGWLLATLAVVNVLYGAAVTMMQTDLKRLIAYSSISHMGYVLLGIVSLRIIGVTGASLQMFSHGLITGLLFFLVGLVYEKTHHRQIPQLGGLAPRMPIIAIAFVVAGLASLGLPFMSGFVAEVTVFLGTFKVWPVATVLGAFGIVLTAAYILWMLQRVFFGPPPTPTPEAKDAGALEMVPLFLMGAAILFIGIYPSILANVYKLGLEGLMAAFS